jgi:hypothetical protein
MKNITRLAISTVIISLTIASAALADRYRRGYRHGHSDGVGDGVLIGAGAVGLGLTSTSAADSHYHYDETILKSEASAYDSKNINSVGAVLANSAGLAGIDINNADEMTKFVEEIMSK